MSPNYYREITLYLNDVAQTNPMRHVPYNEIYYSVYQWIQPPPPEDSYANDFTASILYLVGRKYVEEEAAHYRITSFGLELAASLLYPVEDYPKKSLIAQNTSNAIAAISAFVAIVGLIFLYYQSHPRLPSIGSTNQLIPVPLAVSITQSGFNAQTSPLENWFDQTPSNLSVDGVDFLLSKDSLVVETESQNSSNPNLIFIPIQNDNVIKIHLLINLSYASPKYINGTEIYGTDVAKIGIISGDKQYYWLLKAGTDVRDWVTGNTSPIDVLGDQIHPIWQAHHRTAGANAVIDKIVLTIPDEFTNLLLNYITIEDMSNTIFNSQNPGIMVFGITIERK